MNDFSQRNFEDYLRILYKRKRWLIVPSLLFIIGGAVTIHLLPKYYVANTLVLVKSQKVPDDYIHPIVTTSVEERLKTIQEEIMSRSRLYEIIDRFNLFRDQRENLTTDQIIQRMRKNITIQVLQQDAFAIYYEDKDPAVVAQVANALTDQFIDANLKWRVERIRETTNFLEEMLNNQGEVLLELESELAEFLRQHPGELPQHIERNLRLVEQLNNEMQTKQEALKIARETKLALEHQIAELNQRASQETEIPLNARLIQKLDELEYELSVLKLSYTDTHPKVTLKNDQIDNLIALLSKISKRDSATTVDDDLDMRHMKTDPDKPELALILEHARSGIPFVTQMSKVANHEETLGRLQQQLDHAINQNTALETDLIKIQQQIERLHQRISNAPKLEVQLQELMRKIEQERKQYQDLHAKHLEAQLALQLEIRQKGEQFTKLDEAITPERPSKPNREKIMILSLIFGLGVGLVAVLVRDYFDSTFIYPNDVEKTTGFPVLATIPRLKKSVPQKIHDNMQRKVRKISSDTHQRSLLSLDHKVPLSTKEFYRVLRVKVEQHFNKGDRCGSLLVSSTMPQEGKTTTALHLAWIMTKDANKRVVIVECNFYKPKLSSYLGVQSSPGLADLLRGDVTLNDVLISVETDLFSLIPAGIHLETPEKLLTHKRMTELIKQLKKKFDYVIVDTPSIMTSLYEVNTLSPLIDRILLIIRAEKTSRQLIHHALNLLDQSKLMGITLNDAIDIKFSTYERCVQYRQEDTPKVSSGSESTHDRLEAVETASS